MSDDRSEEPHGSLRTMGPGALTLAGVLGLVGGWLVRQVSAYLGRPAPMVGWTQALVLFFVAAILAFTIWLTRRELAAPEHRPEAHRLVNRLVLARACALVGALVTGGYVGYALSWLGASAELAGTRAVHSLVAGAGGACVLITALLLERACRVKFGDPEP